MIEKFFYPVRVDVESDRRRFSGNIVQHAQNFPDISGCKIALFGVYDERLGGPVHTDAENAFTEIRNELYKLYFKFPGLVMADLGNIISGESSDDTLYAVRTVVNELASQNVVSVILGNHQLAGLGQYAAFDELSNYTEVTVFDNKVSIQENDLVYRIVGHEPNHLFNLNHMGYQTYLCDEEALMAFEKMYFDTVRLGVLRGNPDITEPCLRNSKIGIFDLACIKYADAPGSASSTPNGISAEEACQMARYAGISPRLYSMGFYGHSPQADINNCTAQLSAQMVWYFAEGFSLRKEEDPVKEQEKFLQYRTALHEGQHEIIFYKSKTTGRWWMEIPHPKNHKENTFPIVVPCSYADYQVACNNEMPDRWWRVFQKYT
jgi:formiminoglutamase